MQVNPIVLSRIDKFIKLARKHARGVFKAPAMPGEYQRLAGGRRKKYVYVCAGEFGFKVDGQTGDVRDGAGRRNGSHGNISELLDAVDWKSRRIQSDDNCVPVLQGAHRCELCSRTAGLRSTALGQLCQYCRSNDTRRINAVRRLGGVPTLDGRPLGKHLQD